MVFITDAVCLFVFLRQVIFGYGKQESFVIPDKTQQVNENNIQTADQTRSLLQRRFLSDEKSVIWDVEDQGGGEGRRRLISHGRLWDVVWQLLARKHSWMQSGKADWGTAVLLNQNWRKRCWWVNWKDEMCTWLESTIKHAAFGVAADTKSLSKTTYSHVAGGGTVTMWLLCRLCKTV